MRLGLRSLTLILLLAGIVPTTAVLIAESRSNLSHVRDGSRWEVSGIAQMVAEQHQRAVDTARGTLLAISHLSSVRRFDGAECSRALASICAGTDLWANMGAVRADGWLYCSAFERKAQVNLADRAFFQGALRTGDVAAGTRVLSRVRKVGAFGFGYPVRDDAGQVVAVTFASLRTDALQAQLDALSLPPAVSVVVLDRVGAVITARADASGRRPETVDAELARVAASGERLREITGRDGVSRVWAFAPVTAVDGPAMFVAAALPTDAVEAPVRRAARRTLGTWLAACLAVFLGTGFVAEFVLVRRLRALSRAAARIAAGDPFARSGLRPSRDEVGDLAVAFDEMAGSLEALQRQNRLLLDAIGDGIVGVDRDGRVTFANPAAVRLIGAPAPEMRGASFRALVGGAGTPRGDACDVRQALSDGKVHASGDAGVTRRDGTTVPVEFVTTPVVDAGEIVGAVVALRDVTERRRLEEKLRQAQKMEAVGQLAGGVAHDFNNLLTAIITCARIVQESIPRDHAAQPDVAEILGAGDRAAQLTRQLLAFARRQRLDPRPMDLRDAVARMERMLRRVLAESIALEVVLPDRPVVVHADRGQLELVVLNLAVNARDAMPSGGALHVRVDVVEAPEPSAPGDSALPAGPLALLSVRDEGAGMDEATRARVFEPFFTTKEAGKGTGLGLATVYGIVAQSGGAIRVRSAPGRGSEFRVYLPLSAAPAAVTPVPRAKPVGGRERILVLEDDDVLRSLVCRTLVGAGYQVIDAGRPSDAGARAVGAALDLLVSDVVLPEESGWHFYRRLATDRPGLRVLLMSGFATAGEGGTPPFPGDVPFLAKPFAPNDLLARVREVLDGPPPQA